MEEKEKFAFTVSKKDKKLNLELNVSQELEISLPSIRDILLIIMAISFIIMFAYGIIDFDKLVKLLSLLL